MKCILTGCSVALENWEIGPADLYTSSIASNMLIIAKMTRTHCDWRTGIRNDHVHMQEFDVIHEDARQLIVITSVWRSWFTPSIIERLEASGYRADEDPAMWNRIIMEQYLTTFAQGLRQLFN